MEYKIEVPNRDLNILVQQRLFDLGYAFRYGGPVLMDDHSIKVVWFRPDSKMMQVSDKFYKEDEPHKVIEFAFLYSQVMLDLTKNNNNEEI